MKKQYQDIRKWFPIKKYKNNEIYMVNGRFVKVYKVDPINFCLKSSKEQEKILNVYQNCLKTWNVDLEIIIQTDRVDISKHFERLDSFSSEISELHQMMEDYKEFVKTIMKKRESISRKYYLIIDGKQKNMENKLMAGFREIGSMINPCSEVEMEKLLKQSFKKASAMRKEAKWV